MPAKQTAGGHNVRVTRSGLPQRARAVFVALLLAPALVLSACGSESEKKPAAKPSVSLPTGHVDVPEGTTLTKAGTELKFGQPATVAYSPNTKRGTVLQLTVVSVRTGQIKDLGAYQLDPESKRSTPYYARVTVKNLGPGDLSRIVVPVYAVDSTNSLVQPVSFNNTFKTCPSTSLPAGFTTGKTVNLCLAYLVLPGRKLIKMSYRPLQQYEPITWTGTIAPAPKPQLKPHKKKTTKAQP
jgi:hypothetical protein